MGKPAAFCNWHCTLQRVGPSRLGRTADSLGVDPEFREPVCGPGHWTINPRLAYHGRSPHPCFRRPEPACTTIE